MKYAFLALSPAPSALQLLCARPVQTEHTYWTANASKIAQRAFTTMAHSVLNANLPAKNAPPALNASLAWKESG